MLEFNLKASNTEGRQTYKIKARDFQYEVNNSGNNLEIVFYDGENTLKYSIEPKSIDYSFWNTRKLCMNRYKPQRDELESIIDKIIDRLKLLVCGSFVTFLVIRDKTYLTLKLLNNHEEIEILSIFNFKRETEEEN